MIDGVLYPLIVLLGLILALASCVGFYFMRKKENFTDTRLISQVYKGHSLYFRIYFLLWFLVYILLCLLLAVPYKNMQSTEIEKSGIDIEIVFDVSYSMNADDIVPNRMSAAKSVVRDFISQLSADRVGVVVYAGIPFQSVPLSYDYEFLDNFFEKLDTSIVNQQNPDLSGTAIGDGLLMARDILKESQIDERREQIIILLTDGEANKGADPKIVSELLSEDAIKVYTIGLGSQGESSVLVPVGGSSFSQRIPVSGVNEEDLEFIADKTEGIYYRAENTQELGEIFSDISKLEKSEHSMQILEYRKHSFGGILLILWSILGIIGAIYVMRKYKII